MSTYESVTPDEIEALFMSNNPTLTTAQKQAYSSLFRQIRDGTTFGKTLHKKYYQNYFNKLWVRTLPILALIMLMVLIPL